MTSILAPMCYNCTHFNHKFIDDKPICDAFPDGIPGKIFFEAGDHTKPYKGDHGIQFESKEKKSWKGVY